MLLNINATRAFILCFFTILNQNEFRIATVAMFTCDLYAGSPLPHDLEWLRTTRQRRVVDFVRVGYFIPLNGPLNGHPPSVVLWRRLVLHQLCFAFAGCKCYIMQWGLVVYGSEQMSVMEMHAPTLLALRGGTGVGCPTYRKKDCLWQCMLYPCWWSTFTMVQRLIRILSQLCASKTCLMKWMSTQTLDAAVCLSCLGKLFCQCLSMMDCLLKHGQRNWSLSDLMNERLEWRYQRWPRINSCKNACVKARIRICWSEKTKKQAGAYIFARKSIMPLLHYDNDCCGMMDSRLGWRQM